MSHALAEESTYKSYVWSPISAAGADSPGTSRSSLVPASGTCATGRALGVSHTAPSAGGRQCNLLLLCRQ